MRESRILSAQHTKGDSSKTFLYKSNEANKAMAFKSSWEDTIIHARKQWVDLGRQSERPGIGTNKTFKGTTNHSMDWYTFPT